MNGTEPNPKSQKGSVGEGVKALVRAFHVLFFVLRFLIILIFVYLIFSGAFFVKEHEAAMVFRFGKLRAKGTSEVLTSGSWYWSWPYPIENIKRIPAQRSMTLTTSQFWPKQNPNQLDKPQPTADSEGGQVLRPGEGGYLLTGDANIMHMLWTVTYRVSDAKQYYLRFYDDSTPNPNTPGSPSRNPPGHARTKHGAEAIIESALANAVLKEVATWPVESVLVASRSEATGTRQTLASAVKTRLVNVLEAMDLGVEVQQVSLFEVQPPLATQSAFREVVDAAQEYRTETDNARVYEKDVTTAAEGQASKVIADAKAYQTRVVESVKAENSYFRTVLGEYRKNPKTMLVALYTDAIQDVLGAVETKYIIHSKADGRQEVRLLLGPDPKKPGITSTNQPGKPQ